jgi:hypothetical protein
MAKKQTKSDPPKIKLGRFEKIDGAVVMLPPEEEDTIEDTVETEQLVVEKSNGTVLIQSEFVDEDDLQYVIDDSTENQSRRLANKIHQENKARAAKEAVTLFPEKVGNTVVTSSNSYSDLDLSILNADIEIQSTTKSKK